MKRHSSLAHLSREHHGALILARLLQKNAPAYSNLPTDLEGKAAYALQFYTKELIQHFEAEENALRLVMDIDPTVDLLVQAIFREHQELHSYFQSINDHADQATHLDTLGKALEAHVRKEERELFPLIEETCDEKIMDAIGKSLST